MAKLNVKVASALALSLLLLLSVGESKQGLGIASETNEAIDATLECTSVYAAEMGDTCDGVARKFKLGADTFAALNPNINCDKIFVGQWLCVED